jgi:hypothetical protein
MKGVASGQLTAPTHHAWSRAVRDEKGAIPELLKSICGPPAPSKSADLALNFDYFSRAARFA